MLRDNTYYWRVRALDAFGNAGQWNLGSPFTKTFDKVPPVTAPSVKNLRMRDNLSDPGSDLDGARLATRRASRSSRGAPFRGVELRGRRLPVRGGGICDWSDTGGFDNWRIKTASTAWTMLGSGWGGVKPYPDARRVSSDGIRAPSPASPTAHGSAPAPIVMRACRRSTASTYLTDETGTSFTWVGPPTGGACSPSCVPGNLGSGDYLLPATGVSTTRMPLFTWNPLAGRQTTS